MSQSQSATACALVLLHFAINTVCVVCLRDRSPVYYVRVSCRNKRLLLHTSDITVVCVKYVHVCVRSGVCVYHA